MIIMCNCVSWYKRTCFHLLYSFVTAIVFLLISYIVTNVGFTVSGEAGIIKQSNYLMNGILYEDNTVPDSLLFVNVCYDKQLTDVYDEDGFKLGNIDITNRQSLLRFLDILSQRDDYKFIVLDVFFEDGLQTKSDSLLFARIASMERIVVPAMRSSELAFKEVLGEKAYISDYTTTFFGGDYCKFELESQGQYSIPYYLYSYITAKHKTSWGPFHWEDGKLCNRTLFACPYVNPKGLYGSDGSRNYYNLGSDLLVNEDILMTDDLLADKYIFIGDMVMGDSHETVVGNMPGMVIIANTFISLMDRAHIIPLVVILTLFIIYFIFAYQIYTRQSLFANIVVWRSKKNIDSFPLLGLFLSWFTYSFVLSLFCLFFYYIYGVAYDVLLSATLLQLLDYGVAHVGGIKKFCSKVYKGLISSFNK